MVLPHPSPILSQNLPAAPWSQIAGVLQPPASGAEPQRWSTLEPPHVCPLGHAGQVMEPPQSSPIVPQ
jgi:hypothetical protein